MADELANLKHSAMRLTEWDDISLIPPSTKLLMECESTPNTTV